MSSTKSATTDIVDRIIILSDSYATDKAFLKKCEISNHSFLTDLKKGRNNNPGSEILAQIVRGTGCSGTWLLTGEGQKYPPEPRANAKAAEPEADYMADFMQAKRLITSIAQKPDAVKDAAQLGDLALESSQLTTSLLEFQQQARTGGDE